MSKAIITVSVIALAIAFVIFGFAWGWQQVINFLFFNETAYLIYAIVFAFGVFASFIVYQQKKKNRE